MVSMCVRMRVCVCGRACVRACVCVCECACVLACVRAWRVQQGRARMRNNGGERARARELGIEKNCEPHMHVLQNACVTEFDAYIYMHLNKHVFVYSFMIHVYLDQRVTASVWCASAYVFIVPEIHSLSHKHTYTHPNMPTHTRTHTHTHTQHTHTHTHTHARAHTHTTHTHVFTHTRVLLHTSIDVHITSALFQKFWPA